MHSWNLSPKDAIAVQNKLRNSVKVESLTSPIRTIAGIDVSVKENISNAAIAVLSFPELELIESVTHTQPASFPYIPGLLSFREGDAIMKAFNKLTTQPDLLVFDGHGIAHPRRIGIACHIGVLLDIPSIGCGKSRLCGAFEEPLPQKGSSSDLIDKNEVIGKVLRTRSGYKPVFVSVGHRINLSQATDIILACCPRYKLPETTRWAHTISKNFQPG